MTTAVISILGAALVAAALYIARTARGVRALRRSIHAIDAYAPLAASAPDELPANLSRLAMSLRSMLTRFEGERSFEREQLAAACHEIRSPLTALTALIDLQATRQTSAVEPASQAELELAKRNVKRIEDLVNDVLALSLTAHADHPFAAWGVVELVGLVRSEATAHSVAVPVRASLTQASVVGDPRRLRWAVSNLLANATEHCNERIEVSVQVDQMADGRRAVAVRVADDGPGLGSDDPQRLLIRFRRGTSATAKSKAAGLGLTIVQSVVEDHGGEVWIDGQSDLGGAAFTIILPLAEFDVAGSADHTHLDLDESRPPVGAPSATSHI